MRSFFLRSLNQPPRSSPRRARRRTTLLRLERLEAREVPATFVVANSNGSGAGSLHAAIQAANNTSAADTIVFAPSLAGAHIAPSGFDDLSAGHSNFFISTPITILGTGQILITESIDFDGRYFFVASTGNLVLKNLTLSGGAAVGGNGGSGFSGGGGAAGAGGAIFN